jgi:serine protease Do
MGTPSVVNFADVAERINPAVVNIDSTSSGSRARPGRRRGDLEPNDGDRDSPRQGAGSGFIIDQQGHILTNYHVIEAAERITVTLSDGRTFRAEVVGTDPAIDVALVRIPGSASLPSAPLGDSDDLRVGEWVCAIGNPLGYDHSVTAGVVSFIGRKLFDRSLDDYIQTEPTPRSTSATAAGRSSTPAARWWASTPPSVRGRATSASRCPSIRRPPSCRSSRPGGVSRAGSWG